MKISKPIFLAAALAISFSAGWLTRGPSSATSHPQTKPSSPEISTNAAANHLSARPKTTPTVVAEMAAHSAHAKTADQKPKPPLDINQALREIEQMPMGAERSQRCRDLCLASKIPDTKTADSIFSLLSGVDRINMSGLIANNLAKSDPQAALTWAGNLPSGKSRSNALLEATKVWASKDPKNALEWSLKNNTIAENTHILAGVYSVWENKSPTEALAWLDTLPNSKNRETLMGQAISNLLKADSSKAFALFDNQLSIEGQRILSFEIASKLLLADPTSATSWAATLTDQTARQNATGRIAAEWGASHPDAAAAWAEKLPQGPERAATQKRPRNGSTVSPSATSAIIW